MKKLAILAALALMGMSASAQVATVQLNNWDPDMAIYYLNSGTLAGGADTFVELLGGPDANTLLPVGDTSAGVKKFAVDQGHFDYGFGVVAGVNPGASGFFQLRAWKGAADYASATEKGESTSWTQATGTWNNGGVPQPAPDGPRLMVPASITLQAVPEPSTIALGLLGAAALLLRRRK